VNLCYNNLSVGTLRKIEPYAKRLAEKKNAGVEITAARVNEPLTEAQTLLRKIGRAVYREILPVPAGAIKMSHIPGTSPMPSPQPMTEAEIACNNRRLEEGHLRSIARMSSIWRQLEALNSYELFASHNLAKS